MKYIPVNAGLFSLLIVMVLLASCQEKKESAALPVKADVRPSFVVGLLPEQNVFLQKKRHKPLADYLSRATGMEVKIKLLDSYDAIYNEMLQEKVDAAFFGSLSYVVMKSKIDIEPIARPYQSNGISTYKGVIFALRNSGITEDAGTWKNRRIALVSKSTTGGYIFPRYYLHTKGVKDFEGHFRKVIYTGSHDAAVISVFNGDADIGCASDRIYNKLVRENPLLKERLIVLASSPPVPANTFGMPRRRDPALRDLFRKALLDIDKKPEGREALAALNSVRFIETKEREFEPISVMLDTLGLKPYFFTLEAIGMSVKPDGAQEGEN